MGGTFGTFSEHAFLATPSTLDEVLEKVQRNFMDVRKVAADLGATNYGDHVRVEPADALDNLYPGGDDDLLVHQHFVYWVPYDQSAAYRAVMDTTVEVGVATGAVPHYGKN